MFLADDLIKKGVLKNKRLIEAFRAVDRKDFVPQNLSDSAYADEPLSIGEGQTISQPWTVAFMLELLDPKPGENIMEIGYGSGWVTALLAYAVSHLETGFPSGIIYAIERIPKLCELGKANLAASPPSAGKVRFFCQDGTLGLPEIAKKIKGFNKIIVAASGRELPLAWKDQLKIGGKIVTPIDHSIFEFIKKRDGTFSEIEHQGFAFVPLIFNKNESRK